MKLFLLLSLAGFLSTAWAEQDRDDSGENPKKYMKRNKNVHCTLEQDVEVWKDGMEAEPLVDIYPERGRTTLFYKIPPEASSPSDFATYDLSWDNDEISFYYFMNSQIGAIRIHDKRTGAEAESQLDIADLEKKGHHRNQARVIVGEAILTTYKIIPVLYRGRETKGEHEVRLRGICWREKINRKLSQ